MMCSALRGRAVFRAALFAHPLRSSSRSHSTTLRCGGCGAEADGALAPVFACAQRRALPNVDHVIAPVLEGAVAGGGAAAPADKAAARDELLAAAAASPNPFVRFRHRLYSHRVAMARGVSDDEYVKMAEALDAAVEAVDGTGFRETPLFWSEEWQCFVKDESGSACNGGAFGAFWCWWWWWWWCWWCWCCSCC